MVTPATAVVGEDVVISRPPTGPGAICASLAPDSTQTLELRWVYANDSAKQTTSVTVGADGSFTATMPVPTDIRLGMARVTAIPPADLDCTDVARAAGTPDNCYFPGAQFTVGFAPVDLSPVRIVSTDVGMPTLPPGDGLVDSYGRAGSGPHELTLVTFGGGCPPRPSAFLQTAPTDSLKIVTAVVMVDGQDMCTEQRMPWVTVIAVPDKFRDYRTVSVDNIDTILLDLRAACPGRPFGRGAARFPGAAHAKANTSGKITTTTRAQTP